MFLFLTRTFWLVFSKSRQCYVYAWSSEAEDFLSKTDSCKLRDFSKSSRISIRPLLLWVLQLLAQSSLNCFCSEERGASCKHSLKWNANCDPSLLCQFVKYTTCILGIIHWMEPVCRCLHRGIWQNNAGSSSKKAAEALRWPITYMPTFLVY